MLRPKSTRLEGTFDNVVMIFSDEYDIGCKERLREGLARLAVVPNVVLDFTDVTYIDSTVLSELIRMHKVRAAKGYEREVIVVQTRTYRGFST